MSHPRESGDMLFGCHKTKTYPTGNDKRNPPAQQQPVQQQRHHGAGEREADIIQIDWIIRKQRQQLIPKVVSRPPVQCQLIEQLEAALHIVTFIRKLHIQIAVRLIVYADRRDQQCQRAPPVSVSVDKIPHKHTTR